MFGVFFGLPLSLRPWYILIQLSLYLFVSSYFVSKPVPFSSYVRGQFSTDTLTMSLRRSVVYKFVYKYCTAACSLDMQLLPWRQSSIAFDACLIIILADRAIISAGNGRWPKCGRRDVCISAASE